MRITIREKTITGFLVLLLILGTSPSEGYVLAQGNWPTDAWDVSTPSAQGLNGSRLIDMLDYLDNESALHPTGVMLIRNGYIVLEEYLSTSMGPNKTFDILSCTSSIISALVGVAIEQDLMELNDTLLEFFPDRDIDNYDVRKDDITLEHLLTNTAGFNWEENSDPAAMRVSSDWVQYVLDKPVIRTPGSFFEYNSGLAHLLSAILENVTGMSTLEYAEEVLFTPLGITEYEWGTDPLGIYDGAESLEISMRDLAKFGYLYLNNGSWDGQQIIPQSWIETSSASHVTVNSIKDYGYLWWLYHGTGIYNAVGFTARAVSIIPEYDMVALVSGYDSTGDFLRNQWLHALQEYIIPAAIEGPSTANDSVDILPLVIGAGIVAVLVVIAITILKRKG